MELDYRDYLLCLKIISHLEYRMKLEGLCPVCFGTGATGTKIQHEKSCAYAELLEFRNTPGYTKKEYDLTAISIE